MKKDYVAIINGPNLNRLGRRDTGIYGDAGFEETLEDIRKSFRSECWIEYSQSNCEGAIIDMIQNYGDDPNCIGIVINPGAYAHYSYAIADAMRDCRIPIIEVHISNIFAREDFRHTSVTAPYSKALISGCSRRSYLYGVQELFHLHEELQKNTLNDDLPF